MAQVNSTDFAAGNDDAAAPATTNGVIDGVDGNTTKAAEQAQLEDLAAQSQGAAVRDFDPDAPPEAKAGAALKDAKMSVGLPSRDQVKAKLGGGSDELAKKGGGTGLVSDKGTRPDKPTVSLADVDKLNRKLGNEPKTPTSKQQQQQPVPTNKKQVQEEDDDEVDEGDKDETDGTPGAMPKRKTRDIPDWFKIGWNASDKVFYATPEETLQRNLLSDFVSDAYYGKFYHNAGIIVFAILSSHLVTLFGGGWGWLVLIATCCGTAYSTSIARTRRNARDDLAIEVAKKRLFDEHESADWINHFMKRFWLIYEPVLSATIVQSVDAVLATSTPAFLESIRMTTFRLGTKPPHIDHVQTFPATPEDEVVMEWKVSFTPNDVQDLTHKETAFKVNPRIVLTIRLGVGPAVVGKDIIVENLAFSGTMRVKLKLMHKFPHVKTVDLSFMSMPTYDFSLNPVGFDISLIPGMRPFIDSQVAGALGPMLVDPNVFTLDLEQMLSGAPIDTAKGVAVVTVRTASGLKGTKLGGGTPDPYITVSLGQKDPVGQTKIRHSTAHPRWHDTLYILLNSFNEPLMFNVFDYNEHRPDSSLGHASFDLKTLEQDAEQDGLTLPIIYNGSPRGTVVVNVAYYPCLTEKKLPDGTVEPVPDSQSGVARVTLHQAKELVARDYQLNPFAKVLLNNLEVQRLPKLKRTPNPVWEKPTEFLVHSKARAVIGVNVCDDNTMTSDDVVGFVKIKLEDLLEAVERGQDWFQLSGTKSGRVRLSATWKPVSMPGAISGASAFTPPLGVVKFWFKRARDVKNVETFTGGKSDPYARVLRHGMVQARTTVVNNELDPVWDEIVYATVHSIKDTFIVEVMDYQHTSKDRSLGFVEMKVRDLIGDGPDKETEPYSSTGKKSHRDALKQPKGGYKGTIEFDAQFVPCAWMPNIEFVDPEAERIAEEKAEDKAETGSIASTASTVSESEIADAVLTHNGPAGADADEAKPKAAPALSRETILKSQSGIIAVQIISGKLARKGARLEILYDDGYWPSYSSEPARSQQTTFDEIGEAFIRELDYSQIIFKLNMAEKETQEDMIGAAVMDMNEFLENTLDKRFTIPLTGSAGRSTVVVSSKYIPVDIEIEPQESVNNMGFLRVDLLDGKDLPGADRSGKSDPYAVFELNGEKVHKSEVVKKTLSPKWNENFTTQIRSRVADKLTLEVFDWDRIGSATLLGNAVIDLQSLEPFESKEVEVPLTSAKTHGQQGHVNLRLLFRPQFLARERTATSAFGAAGRVATGLGQGVGAVGGAAIHGVGAVGGGVVHGVGTVGGGVVQGVGAVGGGVIGAGGMVLGAGAKGVTGVGKGVQGVGKGVFGTVRKATGHRSTGSTTELASGNVVEAAGVSAEAAGKGAPGLLTVKIGQMSGAAEPDEKRCIVVHSNGKTVDTTSAHSGETVSFNESFSVKTTSEPLNLELALVHKKTFGSDKTLGVAVVPVFDNIIPLAEPPVTRVDLESGFADGPGQISVTLEWAASRDSDARSVRSTKSKLARSRFSMHKSS